MSFGFCLDCIMKKDFSGGKLKVVCWGFCGSAYLRFHASVLCPLSAVPFVILKAPTGSLFVPHLSTSE